MCFACCHARASIDIDVHKVHVEMVIGGMVVYISTNLVVCHAILVSNGLCTSHGGPTVRLVQHINYTCKPPTQ